MSGAFMDLVNIAIYLLEQRLIESKQTYIYIWLHTTTYLSNKLMMKLKKNEISIVLYKRKIIFWP